MSLDFVVACTSVDLKHPIPHNPRGTRQFTYLDIMDALGQRRTDTLRRDLEEQEFRSRMVERSQWERTLLALEVYPKW